MNANKTQKPRYRFMQDTLGTHIIQDKSGNKITIDCKDLTMSDIRELLKGFGNIIQSISTHTWDKEFAKDTL